MRVLVRHRWPGNIRELQNYIERAVILSSNGIFEPGPLEDCEPSEPEIVNPTLEEKIRREIIAACESANWSRWSGRSSRQTRLESHHAVSQDEAPWYCATCASDSRTHLSGERAEVAAEFQICLQHREFACSRFRDQPMAASSSRSVAELKQKMSRSSANCSPWRKRGSTSDGFEGCDTRQPGCGEISRRLRG